MRVLAEWRERERRNRGIRAKAEPFLHPDIAVTTDRLDNFANAEVDDQLATLAALRERGADNGATELAVFGIAIAVLVALVIPSGLGDYGAISNVWELLGRVVASIVVGLVIVMMVISGARDWIQRDRRRELAAVWLAAYEDELARRTQSATRVGGHGAWLSWRRHKYMQPRTVR
jgi:uncharacterized iron-regulated membrane protein